MELFFLINIAALLRLFFFFKDRRLTSNKLLLLIFLHLFPLLLFNINGWLILFAVFVAAIVLFAFYLEKKSSQPFQQNLVRFLTIIVYILLSLIFTSPQINIQFSIWSIGLIDELRKFLVPSNNINWLKINILLAGILLLLNEINFFIRYLFDLFGIIPQKINDGVTNLDEKEYNAGRVIGMLERLLIFFFVLIGEFTAIGFIIAAKGFTRFKELDQREFAEYVLIGTLLSSLIAIFISLIIKQLLLNV